MGVMAADPGVWLILVYGLRLGGYLILKGRSR